MIRRFLTYFGLFPPQYISLIRLHKNRTTRQPVCDEVAANTLIVCLMSVWENVLCL